MSELANVNFKLLLAAHNGDVARARAAWKQICTMGKYGDVPASYEGGLDVKGLHIQVDEFSQGAVRPNPLYDPDRSNEPQFLTFPVIDGDTVKRIEDLASGDRPN